MRGENQAKTDDWGSLSLPSVIAAAHELKAPLILIRQLAFELSLAGELTADQARVQQRLRMTTDRALRLVENVTKTARLDDAMFALEPIQVEALWNDVVGEIGPVAAQYNQPLTTRIPRHPLLLVAHKDLLLSVLLGLCDNALAHNPSGQPIVLSAKRVKDTVVLTVRDQGPKIDQKSFMSLSQRLGSSPQALGARPGSSGLGLWVAGSFARAMSSSLTVSRHRSGGMSFSLHIPVSKQLSLV